MDVDIFGESDLSDVIPDFETSGVFIESWVLCDNLFGYFGAVSDISFVPSSTGLKSLAYPFS